MKKTTTKTTAKKSTKKNEVINNTPVVHIDIRNIDTLDEATHAFISAKLENNLNLTADEVYTWYFYEITPLLEEAAKQILECVQYCIENVELKTKLDTITKKSPWYKRLWNRIKNAFTR